MTHKCVCYIFTKQREVHTRLTSFDCLDYRLALQMVLDCYENKTLNKCFNWFTTPRLTTIAQEEDRYFFSSRVLAQSDTKIGWRNWTKLVWQHLKTAAISASAQTWNLRERNEMNLWMTIIACLHWFTYHLFLNFTTRFRHKRAKCRCHLVSFLWPTRFYYYHDCYYTQQP